jgi:predicted O-methyltransferase YrrM
MDDMYDEVAKKFKGRDDVLIWHTESQNFFTDFFRISDSFLDFIYIDASHEYTDVLADLEGAWNIVLPGGIIAGDDYSWTKHWEDNVSQAVAHFCASKKIIFETFPVPGHTTQFLIRR